MIRRFLTALCLLPALAAAQQKTGRIDARQPFKPAKVYTKADSVRGMNGKGRAWWDVQFYDLHVTVDPSDSTVRGYNTITYKVLKPSGIMQIDLQKPLEADSIMQDGKFLTAHTDSNVMYVQLQTQQKLGARNEITIYYHGKPRVAKRAPWDGGFVWARDSLGHDWIATAVEGLGASAWWPMKDYLGDEPDSQRIAITIPDSLTDVSNGRLRSTKHNANGTTTYEWFVVNPINSYNVEVNAANYAHFSDTYAGEKGTLTLDFWPLAYHLDTAKVQFQQAKPMLKCFEHWFGPYPWYDDGYKLIETPHLGMEHQSGVAYGNHYKNGYLGRDLSGTGEGLKWDFIIVHESAHEWWGNNVSAKDHADMWVHESFANYAEYLYAECQNGKASGDAYAIGSRHNISNDEPIIPPYGVNAEGSGDMYYKGGNMLHMIRQIIGNDEKWRSVLRGIQSTFWHQTVTGAQIEAYISQKSGIDFSKVFDQYLRTTKVPTIEYKTARGKTSYRYVDVVPGFAMPVRVNGQWLRPSTAWKTMAAVDTLVVDPNFYVLAKPVSP